MQLERHLLVLWRFRVVVAGGVALGILLAILAAYQVRWSDGVLPSLAARGEQQWSAGSRVLVTQVGFPEGRVTLPGATPGEEPLAQPDASSQDGGIKYADPARFSTLAALYAVISRSDQVRARIPEDPEPDQIQAVPLDLNGSGDEFLPIVEITTTDTTENGARRLNRHTVSALRDLLTEEQAKNKIPKDSRVQLDTLNDPRTQLVSGRSFTGSILAFVLCLLAAVALAHILESLRAPAPVALSPATPRREPAREELDDDDVEPSERGERNGRASEPVRAGASKRRR